MNRKTILIIAAAMMGTGFLLEIILFEKLKDNGRIYR